MDNLIEFKRLFSKLWMALSNGSEPKGKAEVYYEKLYHFPLQIVKEVMDAAMSEYERFPTLNQLSRQCGEKSGPKKRVDEEVRYEPTTMLCPKCKAANLERIISSSVPTGGYYYSCTGVTCIYAIVKVDHLDKPTLRFD